MKKLLLKIYKRIFFNKEPILEKINISVIKVY